MADPYDIIAAIARAGGKTYNRPQANVSQIGSIFANAKRPTGYAKVPIQAANTSGLAQPQGFISGGGGGGSAVSVLDALPKTPAIQALIDKGIINASMTPEQINAIISIAGVQSQVPLDIAALKAQITGDYTNATQPIQAQGADWMQQIMGANYDPNNPNAALYMQDPMFADYAGGLAQQSETANTNMATDLAWMDKQQQLMNDYYSGLIAAGGAGTLTGGGGSGGGGGGRGGYGGGGGGGSSSSGSNPFGFTDPKTTVTQNEFIKDTATANSSENAPGFYNAMMAMVAGDPHGEQWMADQLAQQPLPPELASHLVDVQNEATAGLSAAGNIETGNAGWLGNAPAALQSALGQYQTASGLAPGDDPNTPEYEWFHSINSDTPLNQINIDPAQRDLFYAAYDPALMPGGTQGATNVATMLNRLRQIARNRIQQQQQNAALAGTTPSGPGGIPYNPETLGASSGPGINNPESLGGASAPGVPNNPETLGGSSSGIPTHLVGGVLVPDSGPPAPATGTSSSGPWPRTDAQEAALRMILNIAQPNQITSPTSEHPWGTGSGDEFATPSQQVIRSVLESQGLTYPYPSDPANLPDNLSPSELQDYYDSIMAGGTDAQGFKSPAGRSVPTPSPEQQLIDNLNAQTGINPLGGGNLSSALSNVYNAVQTATQGASAQPSSRDSILAGASVRPTDAEMAALTTDWNALKPEDVTQTFTPSTFYDWRASTLIDPNTGEIRPNVLELMHRQSATELANIQGQYQNPEDYKPLTGQFWQAPVDPANIADWQWEVANIPAVRNAILSHNYNVMLAPYSNRVISQSGQGVTSSQAQHTYDSNLANIASQLGNLQDVTDANIIDIVPEQGDVQPMGFRTPTGGAAGLGIGGSSRVVTLPQPTYTKQSATRTMPQQSSIRTISPQSRNEILRRVASRGLGRRFTGGKNF